RAAQTLRPMKARAQPQELLRVACRFRKTAGRVVSDSDTAEEHRHLGVERAQPDRLFAMRDRLAIMPGKSQSVAAIAVRRCRARVEVDGAAERRERPLGAPLHHRPITERDLAPGIAIVERDRPNDMLAALAQSPIAMDPA